MFGYLNSAKIKPLLKSMAVSLWYLLKCNLAPILLFFIAFTIALRNYDPGTFLTGWDTLHPEFNFDIYWERILNGVWQTHQGLGAVSSQAHASEIPRIIIMEFLDIFMTVDQLRYAFAFIMLVSGPLGVFYFLRKVALKRFTINQANLGAFAGGLVYLLNLGTMQHFYVPLEMFLVHYGFLGWVFYASARFYETGSRRHILSFLLFSLLIAPQAHTPTLFYSYILNFALFFGILVAVDYVDDSIDKAKGLDFSFSRFKAGLQRFFILFIFTLLINAFWLVPNIYFVINHSEGIQQSKIHHLFSEEAFLQNKEFGNISDTALIKNFLFNWGEHAGGGQFGELLDEWEVNLYAPGITVIGYTVFGLVCLGMILSFAKKERYAGSAFLMFVASVFFLFNVNPPFGYLFSFLQEHFPIFKEAFRFPFTKFSITLMFSYAVYFGYFFAYMGRVVERFVAKKYLSATVYIYLYSIIAISLLYYMQPAINGSMISPSMRVEIPPRYFEMFDYLEKQKDYGRVADLPIQSFWGWSYHDWDPITKLGYQGAGFLWFGIKQPLLNREFDRWNILNEEYYRDMSLAVYSEDPLLLESTLNKFKIKWILLDESVISPGSEAKMMYYPQIKSLLSSLPKLTVEKDFGAGLKLYKYTPDNNFSLTQVVNNFYYSNDSIFKEYKDPVYETYGNYVNGGNKNFPYVGITNFDESLNQKFISSDDENTYFTNRLTFAELNADSVNDAVQFYVSVKKNDTEGNTYIVRLEDVPGFVRGRAYDITFESADSPEIVLGLNDNLLPLDLNSINTNTFTRAGFVQLDPLKPLSFKVLSYLELPKNTVDLFGLLEKCSGSKDSASYSIEKLSDGFKISARNTDACLTINLSDLMNINDIQNDILSLSVDTAQLTSAPDICVLDTESGLCVNKPLKNGKTYARLEKVVNNRYFLRFVVQGQFSSQEHTVEYKNFQVGTLTAIQSKTLDITELSKIEGEVFGRLTFKKDADFSGNVANLKRSPRFCVSGDTSFDESGSEIVDGSYVRYESHGENICDSYQFPFADHSTGYILEISGRNVQGIPLRICLTNEFSKRCDLYVSMGVSRDFETHYYLVPPMGDGSGYTVNISNMIFGSGVSINDLEYVSLTPFPYDFLRSVHNNVPKAVDNEKLLIYNQAFEKGWIALCGLRLCNAEHVMVNNWSNGWVFKEEGLAEKAVIIFWPQIFEYAGFVLILASFVSVKKFKKEDVYV